MLTIILEVLVPLLMVIIIITIIVKRPMQEQKILKIVIENLPSEAVDELNGSTSNISSEEVLDGDADEQEKKQPENALRKRKTTSGDGDVKTESNENFQSHE
ncbi:unnamed protein product [Rhodiola kirilowii]